MMVRNGLAMIFYLIAEDGPGLDRTLLSVGLYLLFNFYWAYRGSAKTACELRAFSCFAIAG